jgi:hypothetical protein
MLAFGVAAHAIEVALLGVSVAAHALLAAVVRGTVCRWPTRCALIAQGDWGTQFGMLTQHMSELRPGGLAEVGQENISDLLKLYK